MSKLKVRTKFAYGIGQMAEQIKISGFDVFVFFYFQQVLGLSGSLSGAAVGIALIFDALIDPFTGALSDNWKSARGRRHPFMYAAALPLAVFWFALFFPPQGLGQLGLFLWLITFAILVRAAMSAYHVPHIALGAELSEDYVERTSVVAWRVFSGLLGAVAVQVVAKAALFPVTDQYKNGLLNPAGYAKVAILGSIIMMIAIWYSAWGTRDQIPHLPKAPANTPKFTFLGTLRHAIDGYRDAFKLRSFRAVFAGAACFSIAYGVTQTLQTHMYVFFWQFSAGQQAKLALALLPGFLIGISLTRVAHKRFDKKACAVAGLLFITSTLHLPIVLRLLGVLPQGGSEGTLMLIIATFLMLGGIAGGIAITTASSMMADVAQELDYQSGKAQQGVLFSAISLSQQLGSAGGHMVAGFGIDIINFPTKSKDPSAIDPAMVSSLGMLYLTAAVVGFAGVFAYSRYNLTRARHEETLKALQMRRTAEDSAATADATDISLANPAGEQALPS